MKTGFLFFFFLLQTIYKLASSVQIPRAIGAFYHVWKWHNVKRARSEMHHCTTHALYRSKLWQQNHCSTLKIQILTVQRLRAQLNASDDPLEGLEWKATLCHLTTSKSAWNSTTKCTWMCSRVWWSTGAIRWLVADPWCGSRTRHRPTSPKRHKLGFRRSATTLYPSLTGPPPPPTWTRWTSSFGHTSRTSPWPPWSLPYAEYSPSFRQRLWKRHAPSSGSVSRRWLRLKAATLNRCQLYYIIKLPELIFSIKVLK